MWTPETSAGCESDKIAAFLIPYTRGRCLDLGCGTRKAWPGMIGVDNGLTFGVKPDVTCDIADLSMFADASCDGVFSSHALEDFPKERVPTILNEWSRVIKIGGYLSLYVPSANLYPLCGEPGANPAHKWNIFPGDVEALLEATSLYTWEQVEREERSETNEYSLFLVFKKTGIRPKITDGPKPVLTLNAWERNPHGKKRCLVLRYGAIGDQIVAASVLPGLKAKGYHITYNTTPDAQKIILHDPNIDEFLIQDKDQVPNQELGPYWESLKQRYDFIVNLCESVEGQLLTLPGRLNHSYSDGTRRRLFGSKNYLELTHDIADVPYQFGTKFVTTPTEDALAKFDRAKMKGPVIVWPLHGSAQHKVYPWVNVVLAWLMKHTPCHVVLFGDDKIGIQLQAGIIETLKQDGCDISRIYQRCGAWDIRRVLAFTKLADCVVGPETGILNAAAFEAMPKVLYLSHSSADNLTKHWVNTTTLEPDRERAPCFPCHRLHMNGDFCPQNEDTKAAACASAIAPEVIYQAILEAIGARKAA